MRSSAFEQLFILKSLFSTRGLKLFCSWGYNSSTDPLCTYFFNEHDLKAHYVGLTVTSQFMSGHNIQKENKWGGKTKVVVYFNHIISFFKW